MGQMCHIGVIPVQFVMLFCRCVLVCGGLIVDGMCCLVVCMWVYKLYGRHRDLVHKFDTYVSHMLKGLFTNCDI